MDFQIELLQTLDLAFVFSFRTSVQSSTVLFLLFHVHPIRDSEFNRTVLGYFRLADRSIFILSDRDPRRRRKLGIPADAEKSARRRPGVGVHAEAGIRQGKSAWSRWLKKEEIIGRICVFPRDNTIVS